MDETIYEELQKEAVKGIDPNEMISKIADVYSRELGYEPILKLKDINYDEDVSAFTSAVQKMLAESPLPDFVRGILFCINEEDEEPNITLVGYEAEDPDMKEPEYDSATLTLNLIAPKLTEELKTLIEELGFDEEDTLLPGAITPKFMSEVKELLGKLEYDDDEQADIFKDMGVDDLGDDMDEDELDAMETEYEKKDKINQCLIEDMWLLTLSSLISRMFGNSDVAETLLAPDKPYVRVGLTFHSSYPILLGKVEAGKWIPDEKAGSLW